jgi:DNA transposition AAA+ family ATPase
MLHMTLGCALVALVLTGPIPAQAKDLTVAEQVATLSTGQKVKVEMNSGETLKGRMGLAAANQFTLQLRNAAQGTSRMIRFDEARSVKPDGLSGLAKSAIIFGSIWVAIGIVAKLTI